MILLKMVVENVFIDVKNITPLNVTGLPVKASVVFSRFSGFFNHFIPLSSKNSMHSALYMCKGTKTNSHMSTIDCN